MRLIINSLSSTHLITLSFQIIINIILNLFKSLFDFLLISFFIFESLGSNNKVNLTYNQTWTMRQLYI